MGGSERPVGPWLDRDAPLPRSAAQLNPLPSVVVIDDIAIDAEPTGSRHLHWTIVAAMDIDTRANQGLGQFVDSMTIDVEASSEAAALREAKCIPGMERRRYMKVTAVRQACSLDKALRGD